MQILEHFYLRYLKLDAGHGCTFVSKYTKGFSEHNKKMYSNLNLKSPRKGFYVLVALTEYSVM